MEAAGLFCDDEIIADGKLHRFWVHGDKRGKENGWYVLHLDGRPAGSFGSWKTNQTEKWIAAVERKLTAAERRELAQKIAEQKKQREEEEKKVHAEAAKRAADIWNSSSAVESSAYLERKGLRHFGVLRSSRNNLVVPIKSSDGQLCSLQFIDATGNKKFLSGGRIEGCYTTIIGDKKSLEAICICEGYATGASIHQATDLPVAVAFNAGNLEPVARELRKKYPTAKIVVCADNDQWTLRPVKNPGLHYATQAAEAVGGVVAVPEFKPFAGLETNKPTDFNDLHLLEGLPRVGEIVEKASLAADPNPKQTPAAGEELSTTYDLVPPPGEQFEGHEPVAEADLASTPSGQDYADEWPFRCLGCGVDQNYYYLKAALNQVVAMSPAQHTKTGLLHLAPLTFWQREFPSRGKEAFAADEAANALMRTCEKQGIFSPSQVRGRGTWHDNGEIVLHLGDRVIANGEAVRPRAVQSRFVYEEAPRLELDTENPLSAKEAVELFNIMKLIPWGDTAARLASGWVVCAHIGGALRWRPHLWVTGSKGSGKSWVMSYVIQPALGENHAFIVSESTEAGIRQLLGNDAIPVLFDEAEGEDQRAHDRIQRILALARQASTETGAKIAKGTPSGKALTFQIRSCFALSSIKPALTQEADKSRFCVFEVEHTRYEDRFSELSDAVAKTLSPAYSRRLFARAVRLAAVIRANAVSFGEAVTQTLKNRRAGDQYGALLAGNFALHSDREITVDAAKAWLAEQQWTAEVREEVQGMSDEQKCFDHLMASRVRAGSREASIEVLIEAAKHATLPESLMGLGITPDEARLALMMHGVRLSVDNQTIDVARQHPELKRIFNNTPYSGDWGTILRRLPRAQLTNPVSFGSRHSVVRAIRLHM